MLLNLCQTSIFATELDFVSINGYGTIGGAYQDNENILYRNSLYADKGSQGDFSLNNYTTLGLQLDATPIEELTFTLQGVASANNENDKLIDIEWANAKYQLNDTLDIRAGLMRLPTFMFSDILHVAYAYDRLKLPDMYSTLTVNKYTGIEFTHHHNFNDLSLATTLLYGKTESNLKTNVNNGEIVRVNVEADKTYGITMKGLYQNLSFRTAYIKSNVSFGNEEIATSLSQFNAIAALMNISDISKAIQRYKIEDTPISYMNVGVQYDFSNSYLLGEYMMINSDSFLPDVASWNITTGYNFETWAPYIGYSVTSNSSNYQPISTEGRSSQEVAIIDIVNQTFDAMSSSYDMNLKTISLGLRYDLSDDIILKLQYDEQKHPKDSLHIFSSTINFVF